MAASKSLLVLTLFVAAIAAREVNVNQLLAEEALKYPGALAHSNPIPQGRAGSCKIGTNNGDISTKQPLLLESGSSRIALPTKTGEIVLDAGKSLDLYCTSTFASPLSGRKLVATCVDGDIFAVNGKQVSIKDIQCTSQLSNTARKTARSCYDNSIMIEIGFDVEAGFVQFMEVCHNLDKEVTYYVHYSISQSAVAYQKSVARIDFTPGSFYNGKNVNKLYTQVTQMETIGKILGSGYEKYFDLAKNVFLARGHLAAKADFIYGPEQLATFTFINCAPQWQVFNGGNWEKMEGGVKDFAAARSMNLDVYTGTWGTLTLADSAGAQKPLYLAFNGNTGLIPIPKLYYRIIIDTVTKFGIVLIGVNNPHATLDEIKKDYILCDDVSGRINWLKWDKTNIKAGYSYACEVSQFAKKIGQLPALDVRGLLI